MTDCETIRDLLSGYLDDELYQQQRQRVRVHLSNCPACQAEYEQLVALREEVRSLRMPEPDEQEWSTMMNRTLLRTTRGTGWLLWIGGVVILAAYALYAFLRAPDVHLIERVGVLAVILGTVLLFVTVLQERLRARRTDRYKDIEK